MRTEGIEECRGCFPVCGSSEGEAPLREEPKNQITVLSILNLRLIFERFTFFELNPNNFRTQFYFVVAQTNCEFWARPRCANLGLNRLHHPGCTIDGRVAVERSCRGSGQRRCVYKRNARCHLSATHTNTVSLPCLLFGQRWSATSDPFKAISQGCALTSPLKYHDELALRQYSHAQHNPLAASSP